MLIGNGPGQLNRSTQIGKDIYELTKLPEVKTIVDIGTWNGLGSTKCIYDGILESGKRNYRVLSFESNRAFFDQAEQNLFPPLPNFELIYGSILSYDEMNNLREEYGDHKYLLEDMANVKNCPHVFDMIPEKIDLCIMDGGECTGWSEFELLYKRCNYIVLDDTQSEKHSKSKRFVLNNPDLFEVISDRPGERNGCMVIRNKNNA